MSFTVRATLSKSQATKRSRATSLKQGHCLNKAGNAAEDALQRRRPTPPPPGISMALRGRGPAVRARDPGPSASSPLPSLWVTYIPWRPHTPDMLQRPPTSPALTRTVTNGHMAWDPPGTRRAPRRPAPQTPGLLVQAATAGHRTGAGGLPAGRSQDVTPGAASRHSHRAPGRQRT